ncbi:MAG: hypothetical protein WCW16_01285 [Candidatus Magasanikbacteria bacterium]
MLEHLFGSKTRIKLLKLFFREPKRTFFVRELSREIGVQINAVRRELELLKSLDILMEKEDQEKDPMIAGTTLRKYYQLNIESIIYSELQALLLKDKVIGQQKFMDALATAAGEIKLLIFTGVFTTDQRAPTDLLIVGSIKPRTLTKLIEQYETDLGQTIRYTVMSIQEFTDRRYIMDKFLYAVFEADHLKVVNELGV